MIPSLAIPPRPALPLIALSRGRLAEMIADDAETLRQIRDRLDNHLQVADRLAAQSAHPHPLHFAAATLHTARAEVEDVFELMEQASKEIASC